MRVLFFILLFPFFCDGQIIVKRGHRIAFVNAGETPPPDPDPGGESIVQSNTGWLFAQNGVDNFNGTQYAGRTNFSVNMILTPSQSLSFNRQPVTLFSVGFPSLSLQFFIGAGNFDAGLTNEYLVVGKGGSRRGVVSTTDSIEAGETVMITVTSNADSTTIYINGVNQPMTGSSIVSGTSGVTGDIISLSGRYQLSTNTYSNPYYGLQKEVSIWSKTLSNAEVAALYDSYNNAGGLASTTYDLSAHADYATSVLSYFKRNDTLSSANPYAYDKKNSNQRMRWMPNAFWATTQESGSFGYLPDSLDIDSTAKLWVTTTEGEMALNHFARIAEWNGKLFVQWFTHNRDEHGPGQFLRWSMSSDFGETWTPADTLFPPMDDVVELSTREGRAIHTLGFVPIGDSLYALGDVCDTADLLSGFRGVIARAIDNNGNLSDYIHWVWIYNGSGSVTPVDGYPEYPYDPTNWNAILAYFTTPGQRPAGSASSSDTLESKISHVTGAYTVLGTLIEPSEAVLPYGGYLRIWRRYIGAPSSINNYFLQYSFDGNTWGVPMGVGSNLPYPISLGCFVRLDSNKIALVGNPRNTGSWSRDPMIIAVAGPDMIFKQSNIHDLRRWGSQNRFSGDAKHGAYSYPHAILMSNGRVGVVYTTFGKEDIEFMSFDVPDYNFD